MAFTDFVYFFHFTFLTGRFRTSFTSFSELWFWIRILWLRSSVKTIRTVWSWSFLMSMSGSWARSWPRTRSWVLLTFWLVWRRPGPSSWPTMRRWTWVGPFISVFISWSWWFSRWSLTMWSTTRRWPLAVMRTSVINYSTLPWTSLNKYWEKL